MDQDKICVSLTESDDITTQAAERGRAHLSRDLQHRGEKEVKG